MEYPHHGLSQEYADRISPFLSSMDLPVFALQGMSETMKAALFARYSRYGGSLRQLIVEEFLDDLPLASPEMNEGERSALLYERVFLGYGDDSVAQLGGAHIAMEWCSNVLTKTVQRHRISAYLEQSTRYIDYSGKEYFGTHSGFRYYQDVPPGGAQLLDGLFHAYQELFTALLPLLSERYPQANAKAGPWKRAINAKAFDLCRGLLPAATLSHQGIFASGQTYEAMILHMLAHPLPEAQQYGEWLLQACESVTPSFVSRVRRPDRGGEWVTQLQTRREVGQRWSDRLGLGAEGHQPTGVRMLEHRGDAGKLLARLIAEECATSEERTHMVIENLPLDEQALMLASLVGDRTNRRYKPGRGLESLSYRFEICSDYGAFRDLQRHRMLTCQWQELACDLGYDIPEELANNPHLSSIYSRAMDSVHSAVTALRQAGDPHSQYLVPFGYRLRYILDMNAREAMFLCELRSGDQGHISYRQIAQAIYRQIAEVHPQVAGMFSHMDMSNEGGLERLGSEMRLAEKRGEE